MTNLLPLTEKKKKERVLRIKRGKIIDTTEIQKIVRKYYELYANKLDNLAEMDKFLETYNVPDYTFRDHFYSSLLEKFL